MADPNVLFSEVACLNCNSNASEAQLLELAFLQRIDASGGGGGGGGTPDLPLNSVQFNEAGAFGGSADLLWRDNAVIDLSIIGRANSTPLGITGYSLTGANSMPLFSSAGTLNTTGSPSVIRLAITDTASGAATKFLEFLGGAAGATSLFSINKAGQVLLDNGAAGAPSLSFASETNLGIYRVGALRIGFVTNGNLRGEFNNAIFELKAAIPLSFNSSTFLRGDDAANEVAQRNGASAQFYKLYRTFTNSTNYERLSLGSAAGQMIVAAETAGTGTDNIDLMLTAAGTGLVNVTLGIIRHGVGFTVATLPAAGLAGRKAYVTDGLGAAWGVAIAGGGAQTVPVFDNGAAWVAG